MSEQQKREEFARVGVGAQPDRPSASTGSTASSAGDDSISAQSFEALRIKAYRTARVFEPSMDGWAGAMAVYEAVFGPEPGRVEIVTEDGESLPAPRR